MPVIYDPTKPYNEQIRQLIQTTHPQEGPLIVLPEGKRFRREMDHNYWKDFYFQDTPDSGCTKGLLHWRMGTLSNGVQDAFAMPVNDLIEGGFTPFYLQDYIAVQEQNTESILTIIRALTELCMKYPWEAEERSYPIAITGGDTSVKSTMQGFDMVINATGYVRKGEQITKSVQVGDIIIGVASNGFHTNGFSFYRDTAKERGIDLEKALGGELVKPTHVYLPAIKELMSLREYLHGMVHITGGGLSKLQELMPTTRDVDIEIGRMHRLKPSEVFWYGHEELGMSSEQMYSRFNNGIGYVIAIYPSKFEQALTILRKHFWADIIGQVSRGEGRVVIESEYENKTVVF